jgi:hypothetical protein
MAGTQTYPQGQPNTLEGWIKYITEFIDAGFDIGGATGAWIPKAPIQRGFEEASRIKIATVETQGLGTYDRAKGYAKGKITTKWQDYTLRHDRGRSYLFDGIDIMQSNIDLINFSFGEFMRKEVIPEQDSLNIADAFARINSLGGATPSQVETYTPSKDTIVGRIGKVIDDLGDVTGIDDGYVILANRKYKNLFTTSTEVQKTREVGTPASQGLEQRIAEINGSRVNFAPSARMKTAFTINDGIASGQEDGGITAATGAKDIVAIISAPGVIQSITASRTTNIFPRGVAQGVDGSLVEFRIFYDTIIQDADRVGTFALVAP